MLFCVLFKLYILCLSHVTKFDLFDLIYLVTNKVSCVSYEDVEVGIDTNFSHINLEIIVFLYQNNLFFVVLSARQDVKPGVSMVRRVKEAMKKEAQQKETNIKNRQKTYKEQEKDSREAALQSSISNENKGFALLQKMGYKAGQGLGKQGEFSSFTLRFTVLFLFVVFF